MEDAAEAGAEAGGAGAAAGVVVDAASAGAGTLALFSTVGFLAGGSCFSSNSRLSSGVSRE